ncbi:organic cation transporter protein-like [Pomacea canaliculata]|uniref:organic cation transporter protein-like n=1 Tax=Pomacea canaliculata TaxID=400727 RepID=UPI000D73A21F|nr:organic cation transporter protein-like [Pomacea canaliculata]
MVYYGLGLNVGNLSGGLYLNFMYASIAETLSCALCVALLNRLGRRVLHCLTMLLGGVACVAIVFPVLYGTDSKVSLILVWNLQVCPSPQIGSQLVDHHIVHGRQVQCVGCFHSHLHLLGRAFPDNSSKLGSGASSFSARIGGIVSPYIADISSFVRSDFGIALPYGIFGVLAIAAGLASLWLPETLNKTLPETIDEARNFGRDKTSKESCKQKDINSNEPKAEEMKEVWTRF